MTKFEKSLLTKVEKSLITKVENAVDTWILSHNKEIRKQIVQGIVSDISDEMKKNPDREIMEKMQMDMQTMNDTISKIQEELKKRKEK